MGDVLFPCHCGVVHCVCNRQLARCPHAPIPRFNGTKQRNLSNHPRFDSFPDWSPDGKQILYREAIESRSDKSRPIIATLDLVRREVIRWNRVPVPPGTFSTSDFSADGMSILFSSDQHDDGEDNDEIYRFVLADRQLIQLTHSPGRDAGPHEWNPRLSVSPAERILTLWGEIKNSWR